MKSQTARPVQRPNSQRSARSTKPKRYTKQTAHVEARRDGKPLIFGWGGHLSHNEKVKLQRRATWAFASTLVLLIVVVFTGYWINLNVITPALPITSVNGHQIPQSEYRELVALKTQFELNILNGPHGLIAQRQGLEQQIAVQQKSISDDTTQINTLNQQIKKLPAGPSKQRTDLTAQVTGLQARITQTQSKITNLNQQLGNLTQGTIPTQQQLFNQSQVGNDSATWLQDDELIREWLATQKAALQARINPSPNAIERALNDFKANLPTTTTYNGFLSQDNVTDQNIHAMMALNLRRNNLQTYLASLAVSPTYQVLARTMTIDTIPDAQKVLAQLKKGGNFGAIAKAQSVDASTNTKGGDLGWLARGQYAQAEQSAVVENWLFDPARTLNEISPILTENGSYRIVQILNVDPARAVDATTLQSLKTNALPAWLLIQRALPGTNITTPDQTRLFDPLNLPPDLPSTAPVAPTVNPSNNGLPGGP